MSYANSALYSPYGAFELKSKYQRNFIYGTLTAVGLVVMILVVSWIVKALSAEEEAFGAPVVIKTIADLGPPPSIAKKQPQVQVNAPQVAMPKVGIPTPVADEEVTDDNVVIASRQDLEQIVAPSVSSMESSDNIVVDIQEDEYIPAMDEFVPVEIQPEMIFEAKPEYPRLAKQAGITGLIWVKVLVGKDGTVKKAAVYKSSGTQSLDDAAVEAAYKNKFKPGIQNGQPVNCWATYRVQFSLDQ
jgi:protein TonB